MKSEVGIMSYPNLIERLESICQLSEEEIIKEANDQIAIMINTDEISEESCIKLIIYAMQMGAKADGVLCAQEYAMAKALFTVAFDDINPVELLTKLMQPIDIVEIEIMKRIVEKISSTSVAGVKFTQALCKLMMCIIAIDGVITLEEIEVLDDIFDEFLTTLGILNIDWDDI